MLTQALNAAQCQPAQHFLQGVLIFHLQACLCGHADKWGAGHASSLFAMAGAPLLLQNFCLGAVGCHCDRLLYLKGLQLWRDAVVWV